MAFKDLTVEQQAEIRQHNALSAEQKMAVWMRHEIEYVEEQRRFWIAQGDWKRAAFAAEMSTRRCKELVEYEAFLRSHGTVKKAA